MKQVICCVYDSKVEQYLTPFFQRSPAEAIRSFEAAVNQQDHDFHKWAEDFCLFSLGEFDPQTAKIELHAAPQRLAYGNELLARESNPRGQLDLVADADH